MTIRIHTLLLGLFLSSPLAAQESPRAMTFEDVLAIRAVTDPRVSPDGRHVVYVVTRRDLTENEVDADLWLAATAGTPVPRRLTTSPKDDSQPHWSPDGTRIAFLSARDGKPQVFLISPFGGEAEPLTSSKAGVTALAWSPDGRSIAFVAEADPTDEEERRKKEKDDVKVIDREFRFRRLWIIDLATKTPRELVGGDLQVAAPRWSPDGARIAYVTTPTPKADDGQLTDVWVVEVADGAKRKLVENAGPDQAAQWSPDGSQIAILTRPAGRPTGQLRLAVVPSTGGTPRDLAPGFLYQPGEPTWDADGRILYFAAQTGTSAQVFAVPATGGTPRQVSTGPAALAGFSMSAASGTATFTLSDTARPADVYVTRGLSEWAPVKLTDHNPDVAKLSLGTSEVVRWRGRDGREVEGVLILPTSYASGRRYRLITLVHGGPAGAWLNAFPGTWGNYGHVWAGRGWAVFYPNPRGSTGYGEEFLLANTRDWGGGDFHDIQTGIDSLIARGLADPARLGQSGWSYGGYMTAWTLTQTDRFKAVMVGAGLTNMYSMYSTNDLQRTLEQYFGAEPWDDMEAYWSRSAMRFIKQAKTPTLIMHGAADERVPLGQAQELYMGLRKNGVPVEMAVYPRAGHGLQEPRHQLDKMQREYGWFARHVLGEPTATASAPAR